jgi:hypothetical protein
LGGILSHAEEQMKSSAVYAVDAPPGVFATETCLSEGDLLRLTESMVDEKAGVIIPVVAEKRPEQGTLRH